MAHYDSLSSLGKNTLSYGDTVKLMDISYTVSTNYLANQDNTSWNDQIFHRLGIENKEIFCSNHYGYVADRGCWPEFKSRDFGAATRLVQALFIIIENKKAVKVLEKSEESKEVAIDKPLKEESKLSVLLPSKHRNIKQIEIQKEITLNKL